METVHHHYWVLTFVFLLKKWSLSSWVTHSFSLLLQKMSFTFGQCFQVFPSKESISFVSELFICWRWAWSWSCSSFFPLLVGTLFRLYQNESFLSFCWESLPHTVLFLIDLLDSLCLTLVSITQKGSVEQAKSVNLPVWHLWTSHTFRVRKSFFLFHHII
jgi:hypothetical protein